MQSAPTSLARRRARNRIERPPDQCRLLATSLNVVCSLVPTTVMAVMIVTAISEAIRPYSIAVAPDSLARKLLRDLIMGFAPCSSFLTPAKLSVSCSSELAHAIVRAVSNALTRPHAMGPVGEYPQIG